MALRRGLAKRERKARVGRVETTKPPGEAGSLGTERVVQNFRLAVRK